MSLINHYVTDYIRVLDFLIDTYKDVDLLVRKEILLNTLGDCDNFRQQAQGTNFFIRNELQLFLTL